MAALFHRVLRMPIFYKILVANSAIVGLGAIAGTLLTIAFINRFPQQPSAWLIALFAGMGITISYFVNRWALQWALSPLERLQEAVDQVRSGIRGVEAPLATVSDEQLDQLVETFNQMVRENEQQALQMEQLPRRILQAQEDERTRVARELHDEAAQALTSLLVHLRLLERSYDPDEAQKHIVSLRELTAQALEEVRRVALDLHPSILDDLGLTGRARMAG